MVNQPAVWNVLCAYNALDEMHMSRAVAYKEPNMRTASSRRIATQRAISVSLAEDLLAQAKALHINISQAAEAGVARAISRRRSELWLSENQEAIKSSNAFIEKHGLPLAKYRIF